MTLTDRELSRAVSHALRHDPARYGLELDAEGWASADELVAVLRRRGGDWASVDRASLEHLLETATKRRHEIAGDRIRALYGHSLPERIQRPPAVPPARLFHGTARRTWPAIELNGLLPMGRQLVHLSVDRETAMSVGRRKGAHPILLVVDAAAAASAGVTFYAGNDDIWLADSVPARFIHLGDE